MTALLYTLHTVLQPEPPRLLEVPSSTPAEGVAMNFLFQIPWVNFKMYQNGKHSIIAPLLC